MTDEFEELVKNISAFIRDELCGDEIVSRVDNFVEHDYVYSLPSALCSQVLNLQDKAALYVSDSQKRRGHNCYIDENELRLLMSDFLKRLYV